MGYASAIAYLLLLFVGGLLLLQRRLLGRGTEAPA
jgi:ABC-type sugar transport system permease subunit